MQWPLSTVTSTMVKDSEQGRRACSKLHFNQVHFQVSLLTWCLQPYFSMLLRSQLAAAVGGCPALQALISSHYCVQQTCSNTCTTGGRLLATGAHSSSSSDSKPSTTGSSSESAGVDASQQTQSPLVYAACVLERLPVRALHTTNVLCFLALEPRREHDQHNCCAADVCHNANLPVADTLTCLTQPTPAQNRPHHISTIYTTPVGCAADRQDPTPRVGGAAQSTGAAAAAADT